VIAAHQSVRHPLRMEIDPLYRDVIVQQLEQLAEIKTER